MNAPGWRDVFRGKRALVTGHTGFKGGWLALWLAELGAEVSGYALPPDSSPNLYEAARVSGALAEECLDDLCDLAVLERFMNRTRPDFVFHLAAQSLVQESYRTPLETFQTNVMGSLNVLEVLRKTPRPCAVVMVTTDKCYENTGQTGGYKETDPMGGYDPYSASKGAAEIAVSAYRRSFFPADAVRQHGVGVATARAGNVIGGGDWAANRIVPDAVRALCAGRAVGVRNPNAVRPWQHVLEPLSGYLRLAALMAARRDPALCSAWNFGPREDETATVGELMTHFCEAWEGGAWEDVGHNLPHEAARLTLCIDKARELLDWRPRCSLREAVEATAAWYDAWRRAPEDSMAPLSRTQIREYMAREDSSH